VYGVVLGFPIWEVRGPLDETAGLSRHQDYERQARHAMQVPSRPPSASSMMTGVGNRGREHFPPGREHRVRANFSLCRTKFEKRFDSAASNPVRDN